MTAYPTSGQSVAVNLYALSGMSIPICDQTLPADDLSKKYSGFVVNQNERSPNVLNPDPRSIFTNKIIQEFYLPNDYTRNDKVPSLTGFQVYLNLINKNTNIKYRIYRYDDSLTLRSFDYNQITGIGNSSGSVTYTTAFEHNLKINDKIIIEGFSTNGYNGNYLITAVPSTKSFTVVNSTTSSSNIYGYIHNYSSSSNTVTYKGDNYTRIARISGSAILGLYRQRKKLEKEYNIIDLAFTFKYYKNLNIKKDMLLVSWDTKNPLTNNNANLLFDDVGSFQKHSPLIGRIYRVDFKNNHIKVNLRNVKLNNFGHVNTITKPFFTDYSHNSLWTGWEIWAKTKFGPYTFEETLEPDSKYDSEHGWVGVAEGATTNGGVTGDQWLDVAFQSIDINPLWVNKKFKIVFEMNNNNTIYYKSPSPLSTQNNDLPNPQAYKSDDSPLNSGTTSSVLFKIKAGVADNEIDFLTNKVRSVAVKNHIDNAINNDDYQYWSSKPNPSKYGVESIYFDVSDAANNATVIDSVFLDPITPGVDFNVYYSTDVNGPGTDKDSWESLLWSWVPRTFKTHKKQSYNLPNPITAKYIKIEFTSLQAGYYNPGQNDKPIKYQKFPTWVLNYFLSIYNLDYDKAHDPVLISQSNLQYDALDLAFNYYKGDIFNYPNKPVVININDVNNLLKTAANDLSNYDVTSLQNINTSFNQFQNHPGFIMSNSNVLSKEGLIQSINDYFNYSIENITRPVGSTGIVSHSDRNHLLLEKQMPTMYFYATCRHGYKEAWAKFENNKAYFVKIRNIRFERNNHTVITDKGIYKFTPGDSFNYQRNDFSTDGEIWKL